MKSMTSKFCFLKGPASQTLQEAKIQLIDRTTCNSRAVYNGRITDTMICAGKLEGGVDSCQVRNTLLMNTVRSCLIIQKSKFEYCKCNVCAKVQIKYVIFHTGGQWGSSGHKREFSMVAGWGH